MNTDFSAVGFYRIRETAVNGRTTMFRIWGKLFKDNHMIKDTVVVIDDPTLSRTKKVYKALDEICYEFDLSRPIWLKANQNDFIKLSRTRFTSDSFVESIDFDYLDFQVIEEDCIY